MPPGLVSGSTQVTEVRAIDEQEAGESAADVFAELGPWSGESTEEISPPARRGPARCRPAPGPGAVKYVLDTFDLVIACTALEQDTTLVTSDRGLLDNSIPGLRAENWLE